MTECVSVTRRWKRALICGCSHGDMIDPEAESAVLSLRDRWKPDFVCHLGDAYDTAAFRSGAKGGTDDGTPIGPDMDAGTKFLRALRPNVFLLGNHEDRLWRMRTHPSAIVAECASLMVRHIEKECRRLKCQMIEYGGWFNRYRLANYELMHGAVFNEMAARDHAESVGNVIFAHTHRAAMAKGRRIDEPTGICVGTLTKKENMDYAKTRRATLGWSQGVVIAEFTEEEMVPWLLERPKSGEWRLPV